VRDDCALLAVDDAFATVAGIARLGSVSMVANADAILAALAVLLALVVAFSR
jgi:hypothetical protein